MSTKEPGELEGTGASSDEQDQGGHPLFPRPETATGPDLRKFDLIIVQRWLPDGTKEACSRPFKGSELRSWQQIVDLFGGECTYQLIAQCAKSHQYQAYSDKNFFASPARKPFQEDPKRPEAANAHPHGPIPPGAYPGQPPYFYPPPQQSMSPELLMFVQTMIEQQNAAQAKTHDLLFRFALEKQSRPSALEMMREVHEISKLTGQNARKAEATEFVPAAARDEDFTASDVIKGMGSVLVELMKWKASQRESQQQTQQAPPAAPAPAPQPEPAPAPMPEVPEPAQMVPVYVDPATGIKHVFVNGMGWRPVVDPAFYGHAAAHHVPQPQQQYGYPPGYPYPYPYPTTSWGAPMSPPMPAPVQAPPINPRSRNRPRLPSRRRRLRCRIRRRSRLRARRHLRRLLARPRRLRRLRVRRRRSPRARRRKRRPCPRRVGRPRRPLPAHRMTTRKPRPLRRPNCSRRPTRSRSSRAARTLGAGWPKTRRTRWKPWRPSRTTCRNQSDPILPKSSWRGSTRRSPVVFRIIHASTRFRRP